MNDDIEVFIIACVELEVDMYVNSVIDIFLLAEDETEVETV